MAKEARSIGEGDLLGIEEVAALFGVNPATVCRWAREGRLPARKVGKRWWSAERSRRSCHGHRG